MEDALWVKYYDNIGLITCISSFLAVPTLVFGGIKAVLILVGFTVAILFPKTQKLFAIDNPYRKEITWQNIKKLLDNISVLLCLGALQIFAYGLIGTLTTGMILVALS